MSQPDLVGHLLYLWQMINYVNFVRMAEKKPQEHVNKPVWLCSSQPFPEHWHTIFMCHKIPLLFSNCLKI